MQPEQSNSRLWMTRAPTSPVSTYPSRQLRPVTGLLAQSCLTPQRECVTLSASLQLYSLFFPHSFSLEVSPPATLPVNSPITLPVFFTPGPRQGHFVARLDLSFKSPNGQVFVVSRTLEGSNQSAPDAKPSVWQTKKKRRIALRRIAKVTAGPPTGYLSTIPYVKYLPEYPFDEIVVSEGSYSQRLALLQALLPNEFNDAGYAQHWGMLLHAEEHQMR